MRDLWSRNLLSRSARRPSLFTYCVRHIDPFLRAICSRIAGLNQDMLLSPQHIFCQAMDGEVRSPHRSSVLEPSDLVCTSYGGHSEIRGMIDPLQQQARFLIKVAVRRLPANQTKGTIPGCMPGAFQLHLI